jgi:hypothetical protein
MAFEIKRGDRRPRYRVQLTSDGDPVDLTGVTSVRFIMKTGSTIKVDEAADIITAASGIVEYAWAAGDTDTSGDYNVEIELDWSGEKQTFPNSGYFTAKVNEDLA